MEENKIVLNEMSDSVILDVLDKYEVDYSNLSSDQVVGMINEVMNAISRYIMPPAARGVSYASWKSAPQTTRKIVNGKR